MWPSLNSVKALGSGYKTLNQIYVEVIDNRRPQNLQETPESPKVKGMFMPSAAGLIKEH
jgi:hypothetical protein